MKKYAGMVFVCLCLLQGTASGEDACMKTMNQGAATVALGLYEQQCPTVSFSSGVITKDVTYNCCGAAPTIRINGTDWETLRKAGKLDGLRYQVISNSNNSYSLTFRKMVKDSPTTINAEDFFK
ncbi:hypothetical protein POL68_28180 [Stigmatella sp. ncwal1]|uniref:Secreted protein n=1 Tax=Stigmatella ashevillensis TaxID=2995309 RepID=A0ABT5DH20_9BACT|nr:hypothetical protein [Stigmatella ashevillena]MDC0712374.1 hypothetical protein [Stigmatella ashevillena]